MDSQYKTINEMCDAINQHGKVVVRTSNHFCLTLVGYRAKFGTGVQFHTEGYVFLLTLFGGETDVTIVESETTSLNGESR